MKGLFLPLSMILVAGCSSTAGDTRQAGSRENSIQAGRYRTDSLAVADAPGRVVTLELSSDSSAVLTTAWPDSVTVARKGTFSTDGATLRATFPGTDSVALFSFRWRLISSRLVPVEWDRTQFGPAGLTLHLR